ncbi:hypothetical protein OEA41_002683 [Lepraria neglecta]|uniref:Short-chain dehydrogenase n=1 Tax=Lepraria neglecta TaxID=209136 RepID=A0AAD9Z6B5_9LECA|nr:hypothetical protein OEA41_002683 [Lepraria neglecta]
MPFQYKKVLIIGATSGIGEALASRLIKEGSSVIVSGRRNDKLEKFVHEHGKDKSSAVPFDITDLDKIPNFVTKWVSVLANTTSGLALVPIIRCANYCASKAALHHYILCLREQLRGSNVKIVELYPPAVQTELHDEKHQPDIKNGGSMGMPLAEFTDEAYEGLAAGKEEVTVQQAKQWYDKFEPLRQEIFHNLANVMKKTMSGK